jgi:hypothetical protein
VACSNTVAKQLTSVDVNCFFHVWSLEFLAMLEYLVNAFLPGVLFTEQYFEELEELNRYPSIYDVSWEKLAETKQCYVYCVYKSGYRGVIPIPIPQPGILTPLRFKYRTPTGMDLNQGMIVPLISGKFRIYLPWRHAMFPAYKIARYAVSWLVDSTSCPCQNERSYSIYIENGVKLQEDYGSVIYREQCPHCQERKTGANVKPGHYRKQK